MDFLDNFFLLLHFARKGALSKKAHSSTLSVSRELGISQQSVSRKLRELKDSGLVGLESSSRGVSVSITPDGKKRLTETNALLQGVFSKPSMRSFSGVVESGLGEGKYYLSFSQYQKQVKQKLGFLPFSGTLNLRASEHEVSFFIQGQKMVSIEGFKTKERTFGGLNALPVKINGTVFGALIFPDRSVHPKHVCEIIAPLYLRKKLSLEDGMTVRIDEVVK